MTILGEMIREDALREGRNAGREEGRKEGGLYKMVSLICKKMRKGQNAAQIAEALEEEVSYVERICEAAGQYAPEYEVEEVYKEIKQLFRNWD